MAFVSVQHLDELRKSISSLRGLKYVIASNADEEESFRNVPIDGCFIAGSCFHHAIPDMGKLFDLLP